MCLLTKETKPRIAKEDIIVSKIVETSSERDDEVFAFFQDFTYHAGVEYKATLGLSKKYGPYYDTMAGMEFGLDYLNKRDAERKCGKQGVNFIREGFHAINDAERSRLELLNTTDKVKLVKFKIPKGAKYFNDGTGLIVSDRIIYIGD